MLNTQVLPRELTSSVQQLCIERRGEEPFGMDGWGRNFGHLPPLKTRFVGVLRNYINVGFLKGL